MKISIITASYNYENYIKETIESVLAQSYQDWEMIIVDDGSQDNSIAVVNECCKKDSRIKLFQHQNNENKGLAETLKLGLSKAEGEWVVFLESDDLITPDYLDKKLAIINKYPDVDFVFNDVEMFGDEKVISDYVGYFAKQRGILHKLQFPCKLHKKSKNIYLNLIPTFSCVMAKKSLFKKLDFKSPVKQTLDLYLWSQLMKTTQFYYMPEKLTRWRMHNKSYINTQKPDNVKDFWFRLKLTIFIYSYSNFYRIPLLLSKYIRRSIFWFRKVETGKELLLFGQRVLLLKSNKYEKSEEKASV